MSKATQVAFQLDDESLAAVDVVAEQGSRSRAEVLRIAVREFLARRRDEAIDARLAEGYGVRPPGREDDELAELSIEGLGAAGLDW